MINHFKEVSNHIADLFLDDKVWANNSNVVKAWRIFFGTCVISFSSMIILHILLMPQIGITELGTFIIRVINTIGVTASLFTALLLSYYYYKYLLLSGIDLRFDNIILFFFLSIALFGILYRNLYMLNPDYFAYTNPFFTVSKLYHPLGLKSIPISIDFIVYSACTNLTIEYYRIHSASFLISCINIIQVIYGILVIGLFVATFVQHKTNYRLKK